VAGTDLAGANVRNGSKEDIRLVSGMGGKRTLLHLSAGPSSRMCWHKLTARQQAVEWTAFRHLTVSSSVSGAYAHNDRQNHCPRKNHPPFRAQSTLSESTDAKDQGIC
jgi:hypothetical protein